MADLIAFSGVVKVVFNLVFFLKCTKCWKVMALTVSKKLLIKITFSNIAHHQLHQIPFIHMSLLLSVVTQLLASSENELDFHFQGKRSSATNQLIRGCWVIIGIAGSRFSLSLPRPLPLSSSKMASQSNQILIKEVFVKNGCSARLCCPFYGSFQSARTIYGVYHHRFRSTQTIPQISRSLSCPAVFRPA